MHGDVGVGGKREENRVLGALIYFAHSLHSVLLCMAPPY